MTHPEVANKFTTCKEKLKGLPLSYIGTYIILGSLVLAQFLYVMIRDLYISEITTAQWAGLIIIVIIVNYFVRGLIDKVSLDLIVCHYCLWTCRHAEL